MTDTLIVEFLKQKKSNGNFIFILDQSIPDMLIVVGCAESSFTV